jgi:hypothetical protein
MSANTWTSCQGATLKPFKLNDERTGRAWFFRIASLVAIFAVIAAIGLFIRRGDSVPAILLLLTAPAFAVVFAWSWTGSIFAPFEWAKRYVQGALGIWLEREVLRMLRSRKEIQATDASKQEG